MHLIFGLSHNFTESPCPGIQHPMWGQGYLLEDCHQFLRLRRGHSRDLPTAEQGWEQRSWMGQQSWGETWEQAQCWTPPDELGQGHPSHPIPSHPIPPHPIPRQEQAQTSPKESADGENGGKRGGEKHPLKHHHHCWWLESPPRMGELTCACSFLLSQATKNGWDAPAPTKQWQRGMEATFRQCWELNDSPGLYTNPLGELRLVRSC